MSQYVPEDVDYRVMLTFLEFYETFVRFSLFKLYHRLELRYPPLLDEALDSGACRLRAIRAKALEGAAADSTGKEPSVETQAKQDAKAAAKLENSSRKRLQTLDTVLAGGT